jgi:hypothetical protein
MDLDFSFLLYESGSPELFRGKSNIQDENLVWIIESFVYLWNIRILFGFRFQHTNKEIFVLFSTFRLWTRSINIYYSHFTEFFGSCWNIFLELIWWWYIWSNLWMLYIRVTGRGGQKGRCRGLSASATFPLSLPFQPLPKAVFCRHEPVSLSSLPYVPFPPTLRTCEYSVWVKEGMPITDPPPSWNVLFLENI